MLIRSTNTSNNATAVNTKLGAPRLTIRTTKDSSTTQVERRASTPTVKHHHTRAENSSMPLAVEDVAAAFSASASPTPSTASSTSSTPNGSKNTTPVASDLQRTWEAIEDGTQQLQYETFDVDADKLTLANGTTKAKFTSANEFEVELVEAQIFDISEQLKPNHDAVDIEATGRLIGAPNPADEEKEAQLFAANQRKVQYDFEVRSVTELATPLQKSNVKAPNNVLKEQAGQAGVLVKSAFEKFTAITVTPLIEHSILVDKNVKKRVQAAFETAANSSKLQHERAFKNLKHLQDRLRVLKYTASPRSADKTLRAENELNAQLLVCEALLKKAKKLNNPVRALSK